MKKPIGLAFLWILFAVCSIASLFIDGVNLLFATFFISHIICGCTINIVGAIHSLNKGGDDGRE
jgi:hypothetical protein